MYDGMTIFHLGAPEHIHRDQLKVLAKTIVKHNHQNQAITIETINNQYIIAGTQLK